MNTAPSHDVLLSDAIKKPPLIALSTWMRLAGAWLVVGLFMLVGAELLGSTLNSLTSTWVFLLLFFTILMASFGVVH